MNQGIYKLVFSRVLNMYIPVSEAARNCGGKNSGGKNSRRARKQCKSAMVFTFLISFVLSDYALAEVVLPAGISIKTMDTSKINITSSDANNINFKQIANTAVIDYNRLNLGAGQNFNVDMLRGQSLLNRIHDLSPSILNGNVNAKGNLYFINTNGIIFGANAQFNVGSIYAGTLDITDELFNAGFINSDSTFKQVFTAVGEIATGNTGSVKVEAGAQINALQGGKVVLFAENVENSGVINTPDGQTILAAGKKVFLASSKDPAGFLVEVDGGGTATNLGKIVAERGNITMMGLAVNQQGTLTATTSVRANGSIHLLAQDSVRLENGQAIGNRDGMVTLAKNSITQVTPDLNDKEEISRQQAFKYADDSTSGTLKKSDIKIEASLVNIDGLVSAKSGNVTVTALNAAATKLASPVSQRIYLGENAKIDVSGVDAAAPMSRNQIEPELFSDQNKDNPILRDSGLNKAQVYIDLRKGTELIDTKPFEKLKTVTLAEALTDAGSITLAAPQDVIVRKGAVLDVSGGSTTYAAGAIKETNLLLNGKLVPISEAKVGVPYDQTVDIYTDIDAKTGTGRVWALSGSDTRGWGSITKDTSKKALKTLIVGTQVDSYSEGGDAGTFSTVQGDNRSKNVVLEGEVLANTKPGLQQLINNNLPAGGKFIVSAANLEVANFAKSLTDNFNFNQKLDDDFKSVISNDFLRNGFNRINFQGAEKLTLNAELNIKAGKEFFDDFSKTNYSSELLLSGNTQINANIIAPNSNVTNKPTGIAPVGVTTIADGVTVATAGTFTNDRPGIAGQYSAAPAINGGRFSAGNLVLGKNVLIDTSAGAHVNSAGLIKQGVAGSIDFISDSKLDDSVTLQSYGFDKGGALAINYFGQDLNILGNPNSSATDIDISNNFFSAGGFSNINLSGLNVNIGDNTSPAQEVYATAKTWQLNAGFANQAGSPTLASVASAAVQPETTRKPVSLGFTANITPDRLGGVLTLAENTTIRTDKGGSVSLAAGKQVNVLGDIATPSGTINIRLNDGDATAAEDPTQTVFIGEKSSLSAVGSTLILPGSQANLLKTQVFNAGTININQSPPETVQKGAVIIKQGALLDVSGAAITNDVITAAGFERTTLHGDAGTINLTGIGSLLIDGDLKGAATGTGRDGTLNLSLAPQEFNLTNAYPNGSGSFVITQQKQLETTSLTAGSAIKPTIAEGDVPSETDTALLKAQISAQQITDGGFANLSVKSFRNNVTPASTIELANGLDLKLAGNLKLETPVIKVKDNGVARLTANHITFKSPVVTADTTLLNGGTGQLTTQSNQTYIDGATVIAGVNKTALNNALDIHGQGNLTASGDIDLTARQIFPNTAALNISRPDELRFEAVGDGSKISINSNGAAAKPVLSANGGLVFKADDIVQNGNLTAPFGTIKLEGKESVTLTAASKTSISANNLTIPFLQTQKGGKDLNPLDTNLVEKRIDIISKNVDLQKDAVLDLSSTGSLFSYEFISGLGGTNDVLNQANTYAVIPNIGADFAPVDIAYNNTLQAVGVGQSVFLTGVPGLATGTYTLLPARYALVPGAFMVQAKQTTNLLPGLTAPQLDGANLTTGYFADAGTGARDANWSTFKVTDGAIFRPAAGTISKAPSQYLLSNLTDYFSNPFNADGKKVSLPVDAGKLSLEAANLKLDAVVIAEKGKNGSGLQVDIASDNIRVVSNQDASDTTSLQLTANSINNLKAESVLLGGTSKLDANGVNQISTKAKTVVIENNSADVVTTPTFIAAATDQVTVKTGAAIDTGLASKTPTKTTIATNGQGALLALSSANDISYSRVNGSNATQGALDIELGSTLAAGNSVVLDATNSASLNGDVKLQDGGSATLGANRILIGNAPVGTVGLNVNAASLAALGQLKALALNSYSNVDTFGAIDFGNNKLDLTIDAAGIVGNLASGETAASVAASVQAVTIAANNLTLKNTSGATLLAPTNASGRALAINANSVKLEGKLASNTNTDAGKTEVAGYTKLDVNADELRVANTGETKFNVANAKLSTGIISGDTAADYKINASNLEMAKLVAAKPVGKVGFGAKLGIEADNLTVASNIDLASGQLALTSKTGDLNIENGANISAKSNKVNFDIAAIQSNAGNVTLNSTAGNVNVKAGAVVDVTGEGNANAGVVKLLATSGTANIVGQLKGSATGTGKGGELQVDVNNLADLTTTDKQATGFSENRNYRVRNGDVAIAGVGVNALSARDIEVSADTGKITVTGDVIATAPKNSQISLYAGNGVTLEATANLKANSTKLDEEGGQVKISATTTSLDNTPDLLNFKSGSQIDVSGGANGAGGDVTITAPRTLDNKDIEIAQIGTTFTGVKDKVNLVGEKVYEKTGTDYSLNATDLSKTAVTGFYKEAETFMQSVHADTTRGLNRLSIANSPLFTISPEVDVVNKNGSLSIPVAGLSLHDWRFDAKTGAGVTDATALQNGFNANGNLVAGVLSLRAAKDINVKGTLSDGFSNNSLVEASSPATPEVPATPDVFDENGEVLIPGTAGTAAKDATGLQGIASWALNLVAGADFSTANQLTTNQTLAGITPIGDVVVANNKGIRTGTGDINIAAAGDLKMGGTGSVIYTAGRNAGPLAAFESPTSNNPLYLTDGGDININTKGNIVGGESTTATRQLINNWLFRQGGGSDKRDTTWWVRPDKFQQSTATLGGGNVTVNAGKNISNFSVSAATTGRFDTNGTVSGSAGNQAIDGGGDVLVKAAGDITNGVYFVSKGDGELDAGGSIDKTESTFGTVLALQDGTFKVNANKSAYIETVVNPTLLAQSKTNDNTSGDTGISSFYNSYSDTAKVTVSSLQENVTFGQTPIDNVSTRIADFKPTNIDANQSLRYYPSKVNAVAFNGDVTFGSETEKKPIVLLPSATGELKLLAANDVQTFGILMSDADLINVGSIKSPLNQKNIGLFDEALENHAPQLLHKNAIDPVLVVANTGAIFANKVDITLPKFARFVAGDDIVGLQLNVQHNNTSDISLIKAGNDVKTQTVNISGSGELLVQASGNVDLVSPLPSTISAIGNTKNAALSNNGASITMQAGLGKGANVQGYIDQYILPTGAGPAELQNKTADLAAYKLATTVALTAYMRSTQKPSDAPYTEASALAAFNASSLENKTIFANRHISTELVASALGFAKAGNHNRGDSALATLFPTKNLGDVLLFNSKISTNSGGSIDILAPGGEVIIGAPGVTSGSIDGQDIGVITEKGGPIRVIADKNIEVNQSKVITQFGSDIVMWSNAGTIDAGKGAKSATSTPQRLVQTDAFGNTIVEVRGTATGSGIRAQSYDPDGPNNPELEPKKGDVYLIAPVVDAGEAGIEAGDLLIVAPVVLNAANIQVQGASSGVPVAASANLAGVSAGLSPDAVNSATAAVAQSVAQSVNQQPFIKPVLPSIINVEVISIGE
jgi:filamentous hemagglutinin family protein